MDLKEWKKLAEQEVYRYRDSKAYVQGVLDSGGAGGEKMRQRARWVLAIEYVKEHLERTDPQKAYVFTTLFGLDSPLRAKRQARTVVELSIELHVSTTAIYQWKSEMLSLVLHAAAQTGAMRMYRIET